MWQTLQPRFFETTARAFGLLALGTIDPQKECASICNILYMYYKESGFDFDSNCFHH
jgi:hypothetical protein